MDHKLSDIVMCGIKTINGFATSKPCWNRNPLYIMVNAVKSTNVVGLCSAYFTEYSPMLKYNPTTNFSEKSEILKMSDYNPTTVFESTC